MSIQEAPRASLSQRSPSIGEFLSPLFYVCRVLRTWLTKINQYSNFRKRSQIWKSKFAPGLRVAVDSNWLCRLRPLLPLSLLQRHAPRGILKARANGKGKKRKNTFQTFRQLMDMPNETRPRFLQMIQGAKGICFPFQEVKSSVRTLHADAHTSAWVAVNLCRTMIASVFVLESAPCL